MSVPLLHRKCNHFDYIYRSSYKPIATKRSGSRNQPKRCLRAPQNMPFRTLGS